MNADYGNQMDQEHPAFTRTRCRALRIFSGFCLLLCFSIVSGAQAADRPTKRVLIVHSFGSTAPPFTTHSTAFATALKQEMGKQIDLGEVSLDMARYAQPDMEDAFVEFLRQRLSRWQPDLVIPVGSPAGRFIVKFRDSLFPQTPVIYTGMDRRTLPPGPLRNASFVGESFDLAGLVENILQLAPDTKNIAVVVGATPLERFWTNEFRKAFEPFADRVNFTWFNDLSFEQMMQRAANMPPQSFLLLGLFLRDALGVTHNQEEALQRLHAVANAPINGLFQHELGLGIVGGRLYQAELQGVESARIAVRVVRGEPITNFPPFIIPPSAPQYDWRELQRWKIPAARLPPGSIIAFRQPTAWDRYKWYVVGALCIIVLQAALIGDLWFQRSRRRRAEQGLAQSRQFMELATEAGRVGLWVRDLAGRSLWANPQMRALLGFGEADELSVEKVYSRIHPDDLPKINRMVEQSEAAETPFEIEFRTLPNGGPSRWIVATGRTAHGGNGNLDRRMGTMLDITSRKVAEQKLAESEERFRTVADAAPVMIGMFDVDQRCIFLNKAWLDFTRRTLDQELGHGWREHVHPDDLDRLLENYRTAFDARKEYTLEYRLRRHDGVYRWLLSHGVPRFDSEGTFLGYIGSAADITERKQGEEAVKGERQFLRQVIDINPNLIFAKDREGRFTLANRAVAEVYGTSAENLVGKTDADFNTNAEEVAFFHKMDLQVIDSGEDRFISEEQITDAAGHVRWLQTMKRPIVNADGSVNQVLGTSTDITQRKATELELRDHRAELAHVARISTMGELAASLAHELNQPLTAILANAQAALRFMSGNPPMLEDVREILQDIVKDNSRAGEVIRRMRALVKKGELEFTTLDLSHVFQEVALLVHSDAILLNVALQMNFADSLPPVHGDKVQIQQVVLNLLLNAFDAMKDCPANERVVDLTVQRVDGFIETAVRDRGPGLSGDKLDKIFQPFFTTKGEGLGMGLSISRSIIEAHGGRLWADNNPDRGAAFYFTLPLAEEGRGAGVR